MPDAKLIRIYYEGDDDRAFLAAIQKAGLFPPGVEIASQGSNRGGKDQMLQDLASLLKQGGRVIALRDLDSLGIEQLIQWMVTGMQSAGLDAEGSPSAFADGRARELAFVAERRVGRVALVPIGLSHETALVERHQLVQFAMDDYLLRLVQVRAVYAEVTEFREVAFDAAAHKLDEVRGLLVGNGIPIRHSKRLLHLLRGITGFRASPATFAERLIGCAATALDANELRRALSPILDDLLEAQRRLSK